MSFACKCDRCKKYFDPDVDTVIDFNFLSAECRVDLCKECTKDLEYFIKGSALLQSQYLPKITCETFCKNSDSCKAKSHVGLGGNKSLWSCYIPGPGCPKSFIVGEMKND